MKVSAVAIALALFATPALAEDFDGTPFHVGSGGLGCMHFELKEVPGVVFGFNVETGQNQPIVWGSMVSSYSAVGKEFLVHAGKPMKYACGGIDVHPLEITGLGHVD